MSLERYARTPIFGTNTMYGTSFAIPTIRTNIELGNIRVTEIVSREKERLDILTGKIYGDAKLFWLIAAASNIGFTTQVPPGTVLRIPNIEDCAKFF
jgi:hypothetical protein